MQRILNSSWALLIMLFCMIMFPIVIQYTTWELDIDFLMSKQNIIYKLYYKLAFYVHIFSSLIILICGAFLFSSYILRKYIKVHRIAGRLYVSLLLLLAAPSGLVMAYHANGGWLAQLSFIMLSIIWWLTTYKGFQSAMQRKFKLHQKWMIRSYALTLSAITLRLGQVALGTLFDLDMLSQYIILSWVSWMINLMIAEIIIYRKFRTSRNQSISSSNGLLAH